MALESRRIEAVSIDASGVSASTASGTSRAPASAALGRLPSPDFTDYLTVHQLSLLNSFTFVSVFFRISVF